MENFKVEDMKVGDSFVWESFSHTEYTTTKVSDNLYETSWGGGTVIMDSLASVKYYTTFEDFKLLKVDFKNTFKNSFTKSDLISGEHIVETVNGDRFMVAGEYLIDNTGYMPLSDYDEYLQYTNENYTVSKVFNGKSGDQRIYASGGLAEYLLNEKLEIIYDRQENEHRASQKAKLLSLEESIAEKEKEAEKLREELGL